MNIVQRKPLLMTISASKINELLKSDYTIVSKLNNGDFIVVKDNFLADEAERDPS